MSAATTLASEPEASEGLKTGAPLLRSTVIVWPAFRVLRARCGWGCEEGGRQVCGQRVDWRGGRGGAARPPIMQPTHTLTAAPGRR